MFIIDPGPLLIKHLCKFALDKDIYQMPQILLFQCTVIAKP